MQEAIKRDAWTECCRRGADKIQQGNLVQGDQVPVGRIWLRQVDRCYLREALEETRHFLYRCQFSPGQSQK